MLLKMVLKMVLRPRTVTRTHQNHDLSDDTVMYQMHIHLVLHLIAVVSYYSQNMGLSPMLDNLFLFFVFTVDSNKSIRKL